MGMFDRVRSKCECGATLEWQSKAGECILQEHTPNTVPTEIAKDIDNCVETCWNCGSEYEISIAPNQPTFVSMSVRKL